jgi:hypothetical protein
MISLTRFEIKIELKIYFNRKKKKIIKYFLSISISSRLPVFKIWFAKPKFYYDLD